MKLESLPIHGFTLIRNGVFYDYPFAESFESLAGICSTISIAFGASNDTTEDVLKNLPSAPKFRLTHTVWDENLRKGGTILSQQTNVALSALRLQNQGKPAWGFYLQADEVISDEDYALIRTDLDKATAQGCDAVRFRYFHFWLSYERIAIAKRWYPQEIRAIRLDSSIESYGDAQSFRGFQKVYESDAVIYHYGHVRQPDAYARKVRDFHRWWHSDEDLKKKVEGEDKVAPDLEKVLRYLGPHPITMKNRIKANGALASVTPPDRVEVFSSDPNFDPAWPSRIAAKDVVLNPQKSVCPREFQIYYRPGFWRKLLMRLQGIRPIPDSMGSKHARPFTEFQRLVFACSAKGISVRRLDEK